MEHKMSGFALMNDRRVTSSVVVGACPKKVLLHHEISVIPPDFALNEHREHNTNLRGVPA
jgi:hypothetical protein